jgi:hypothetical protein
MKEGSIKTKIIRYVMVVSIVIVCLITSFMVAASFNTTDHTMLNTMEPMVKIASQNVSSNLHLLTERMYQLSESGEIREMIASGVEDAGMEAFLEGEANKVELNKIAVRWPAKAMA